MSVAVAEKFEPKILALACNWCSYAGADLAGISRCQYPANVRIIRVMCSGMVHPNLVVSALEKGADGVVMCGCHIGDCHYQEGNVRAERRARAISVILEDLGYDPRRFKLAWVSAAEGPQFASLMTEFTEEIRQLGPNRERVAEPAGKGA
jgi:F420-non-reducing hydrogenase iron-sulfur subunit